MKAKDIRDRLGELCTHITFEFDGMSCGIDPLSRSSYEMWCGECEMTAKSLDEVMHVKFFKGCALEDIVDKIKNVEL